MTVKFKIQNSLLRSLIFHFNGHWDFPNNLTVIVTVIVKVIVTVIARSHEGLAGNPG